MKLITFATVEEAQYTLEYFEARPISDGLYQYDLGMIAITGIGPFAAHIVATALSENVDEIINIGLAGSLNANLEVGTIHSVAKLSKYLWHPKGHEHAKKSLAGSLPAVTLKDSGLHLCTVDWPVVEEQLVDELRTTYDIVDMEGYSVAFAANALDKKCMVYKIISDHCSSDSSAQIRSLLGDLSRSIATFLGRD